MERSHRIAALRGRNGDFSERFINGLPDPIRDVQRMAIEKSANRVRRGRRHVNHHSKILVVSKGINPGIVLGT